MWISEERCNGDVRFDIAQTGHEHGEAEKLCTISANGGDGEKGSGWADPKLHEEIRRRQSGNSMNGNCRGYFISNVL